MASICNLHTYTITSSHVYSGIQMPRGKDPPAPPILPKIEFLALIKRVIRGKAALCASNKGSKKLKGNHNPEM